MAEHVEIPLTGRNGAGRVAIVDSADAADLQMYRWHAFIDRSGNVYARRAYKEDGRVRCERMHRRITGLPGRVDHANGNTLDNRRVNLRAATAAQNVANSSKRSGSTSRFKGVSRAGSSWLAHIKSGGRSRHLGRFADEAAAARAYDEAARAGFGEFARLNFPLPGERGCLG